MILIVDNYDSFTYNLYQYIGEIVGGEAGLLVVRNDQLAGGQIDWNKVTHIVISPGPKGPWDAGDSLAIVRRFGGKIPILGVCLGHQVIGACFGGKIEKARRHFIPVVMGGVPSIEESKLYIQTCIEKGCGLIEIGVPFSDPVADGKMIAQVHAEGVAAGITVYEVFDLVRSLRKDYKEVPIALMLYRNMIHDMGIDSFFEACGRIGIDGVIVPDMTLAECKVFEGYAEAHNVYMIRLVAPRSRHRIAESVEGAKGFLYCVSSLGGTGMRESFGEDVEHFLEEVRAQTELPLAVGFGISKPCHVTQLIPYVDAVIVGSAIAHVINKKRCGDEEVLTDFLEEMIQTLKR